MDVDQDLREFQRQYLDFLDDDVSVASDWFCQNDDVCERQTHTYSKHPDTV